MIASYSNTLHTMGTFRAWRSLGSKEKWLRIHDKQEWPYDRVEKLAMGEIVELDIVLSPLGLAYEAGETLRMVVSSKDELGSVMPGTPGCTPDNQGIHVIHTGNKYASYLQLPLIK